MINEHISLWIVNKSFFDEEKLQKNTTNLYSAWKMQKL